MHLPTAFIDFIAKNKLLQGTAPTLLAVSGGLDSTVLAYLFQAAAFPFGIVHCNFQLRAEESDGDELFVQNLALQYGVPFFTRRFDTTAYAEQNGMSIQMAARDLRYTWFAEIRVEHRFGQIATAHHANDNVETVLFNFARGTGLAGFGGIPVQNGFVIRPLLFASRAELETYAAEHQLSWREDRSNASDDYARNFIRHHLVPLFEKLNPNFLHTSARTIRRLGATQSNTTFLVRQFLNLPDPSSRHFSIDKQRLAQLPDPRQALREILDPYGFTQEQARQLTENEQHTGLVLYSDDGWQVLNDRLQLVVSHADHINTLHPVSIQADDLMIRLPDQHLLLLSPAELPSPYPDGRSAIIVDAEKLQFPLLLRPWQPSDWFQPFGMQGQRQKLQDFLTNVKLSRLEKDQVWILENGDGTIIWVLGHRPDERFKIQATTTKAFKISFL